MSDISLLLTPGRKISFPAADLNYADYIQLTQQLIRENRLDLTDLTEEEIQQRILANSPSEYMPTSKTRQGILLIHGLSSSPSAMSSLMSYFGDQGYLVRSILLPGHGTRPGDLLNVTYEDWLEACRFGIRTLREEVEHVTVIGFSAGTALATYLSLTENSIDSLVLLAPAISLRNPLIPLVPFFYPLRQYHTRINWPILKKETDYAKYQSLPINAVYQIRALLKNIHQIQKPLSVPVYMASSVDDETISHAGAVNFFQKQINPLNRGIIYTNQLNPTSSTSLICRKSYYPEENILDFSHISLPIASNHPHYGKNGDFADFTHYEQNAKLKIKHQDKPLQHGATITKNLKKHHIQRLSYNPDFDYLVKDIHRFLKDCIDSERHSLRIPT